MIRPQSTADLLPSERRILDAIQQLWFGRIERLRIWHGEVVLDPWPTTARAVKFCAKRGTHESAVEDSLLKQPFYTAEEEMEDPDVTAEEKERKEREDKNAKLNGWEIGYQRFTINCKALGYGDPIRVKEGQRVLFHILNGSATENIQLALPGHRFQVIALDGNPVPRPQSVDGLDLGTGRAGIRCSRHENPGVWALGTPHDDDRKSGMGKPVPLTRS